MMSWNRAHTIGRLGRWSLILGLIGLLVVFGFSFAIASWNSTYYSAAGGQAGLVAPGSDAANAFRLVQVYTPWMNALQFLSIGLLLTGIALQLVPIVSMLAVQGSNMTDAFRGTRAEARPEAVPPVTPEERERRAA